MGLSDLMALLRAIDRLPARLTIIGMEAESFEPGTVPSQAVSRRLERMVEMIAEELRASGQELERI